MTHFAKGNKGRPKGAKNKSSFGKIDWSETDKKKIIEAIMKLVEEKNPTLLSKFLDHSLKLESPEDDNKKIVNKIVIK